MPLKRPCAAFEPISPCIDLESLVESTLNFEWTTRIHVDSIVDFEKVVWEHVIQRGRPLVVDGYEAQLNTNIFSEQWLSANHSSKIEDVWDLSKHKYIQMTTGHYLKHMSHLTNQWSSTNFKDPARQRLYLKDIDCPDLWNEEVRSIMPPFLYHMNDNICAPQGLVGSEEPQNTFEIARAGDLMSSLPPEMRAANLLCYIGHEGTYTPCHREMCGSLGHNIMVEASTGQVEDGKTTIPGSSVWFMTETAERHIVSEYWRSRLGHDIEVESHFARINTWRNAPFKTYVVEQKQGDLVLIPSLAPHQVWNRGTRTMKVAWNRITVETLDLALSEALSKARMVCRDEQYKNKAIIYYTLHKYSTLLYNSYDATSLNCDSIDHYDKLQKLQEDFNRLHSMFTEILVEESFLPTRGEKNVEMISFDSNITCSYCRCNIFNRFLTCPSCIEEYEDGDQNTYDICLDCYAMGRSCACISKLHWAEQFNWNDLVRQHDAWAEQIVRFKGNTSASSPTSLKSILEESFAGRRTTAQICQLELARRPWCDITIPKPAANNVDQESRPSDDSNGNNEKRKIAKATAKIVRGHGRCHMDKRWEPEWKQAACTTCDKRYCYGTLFRAYDMLPQDILANLVWKCPSCLNICDCNSCRRRPKYQKYNPKGTHLGLNTKAIADPRSVESLVDFSCSNISWLQKAGDDDDTVDTYRMHLHCKAAMATRKTDHDIDDLHISVDNSLAGLTEQQKDVGSVHSAGLFMDPILAEQCATSTHSDSTSSSTIVDEYPEQPYQSGLTTASPHSRSFFLPEGAIEHDEMSPYQATDAVNFVYPDPDTSNPVTPSAGEDFAPSNFATPPAAIEEPNIVQYNGQKRRAGVPGDEGEPIAPSNKRSRIQDFAVHPLARNEGTTTASRLSNDTHMSNPNNRLRASTTDWDSDSSDDTVDFSRGLFNRVSYRQ